MWRGLTRLTDIVLGMQFAADVVGRDKAVLREAIFTFFETHGALRSLFDKIATDDPRLPGLLPSRVAIQKAVITMVIALDLGGGSDFYDLLKAFFWEPEVRAAIEEVMRDRQKAMRVIWRAEAGASAASEAEDFLGSTMNSAPETVPASAPCAEPV